MKLEINGTKFGCTHKKTHEKLDSIDLEGYVSHLSNQTHSARPKYAENVRGPFSAVSGGVVVVSNVSKFVRLLTLTYGAQWQ